MGRKVKSVKKVEKNKFIKKYVVPVLLSLTVGTGAYVGYLYKNNDIDMKENKYGFEDIKPWDFLKVKDHNFIIFDIGNHNVSNILFLDKKIEMCNEKDISVGICISSNADNELEIYNDVELAKSIVAKHKIDFPVYLNIDYIMENDNLNLDTKTKLIKDFLEKCQSNNIYVGVQGKDDNLVKLKKYCNITNYDAFVLNDSNNVKYDGIYNLTKEGNKFVSKQNLSEVINDLKLNDKDRFYLDGSHKVLKDESILDISFKYGMSVAEILEFNNLKKEDIKEGIVLRIPCIINRNNENLGLVREELDIPIRGCDISEYQNYYDWEKIKENFEFVLVRISYGTRIDYKFEENVYNCNINNIPIGIYCFNTVRKNNDTDEIFRKNLEYQAELVIQNLNNKRIDYPVFFDLENLKGEKAIEELFDANDINLMLDVWYEKIIEAGYEPGLYCSYSVYSYIDKCVDYDINDKFSTWISGGSEYNKVTNLDNIKSPERDFYYQNNKYTGDIYQVNQYTTDAGAASDLGYLDINYSYIDYTTEVNKSIESDNEQFDIKEFNAISSPKKCITILGMSILVGTPILVLPGILIKKKRNKTLIKNNKK